VAGQALFTNGAGANPSWNNVGSAASNWVTAMDIDLTAEATQTLTTDGNYTIGGLTWTKAQSTNDLVAMKITNGTGLVIQPKATSNNYNGTTRSAPYIYIPVTSIIPGYDWTYSIRLWIYISADTGFTASQAQATGVALDNMQGTAANNIQYSTMWYDTNTIGVRYALGGATTLLGAVSAHSSSTRVSLFQLNAGAFFLPYGLSYGAYSSGFPAVSSMTPILRSIGATNFNQDGLVASGFNIVLWGCNAAATGTPTMTIARVRVDYKST
jgi:hypothetical protein